MMTKLEKLLDVLTDCALLVRAKLEKEVSPLLPVGHNDDAERAAAFASPKTGKKSKTRSQGASTEGVLEEPALAALTEEESKTKILDVANAFVERFKKAPEGSKNGYTRLKEILSSDYKTLKLADLVHSQRLALITRLNAEMAA